MKKFLFAALMLFIVNGAFAQDVRVGLKAGGNLSTITNDSEAQMKFGFHVGGFLDFKFTDMLSLQPEVLFSMQGAKGTADGVSASLDLNYINVPVLLKINFGEGLSAEIGPQVGYLVSANASGSYGGFSASRSIKDMCEDLDVTAIVGLSYTFAENFVISARYGFGLTAINVEGEKPKNSVISLSIGYKF
jgi:hypothetical protein